MEEVFRVQPLFEIGPRRGRLQLTRINISAQIILATNGILVNE